MFVALLLSLPGCWLLFPPVPVPDDDGGVFIFDDGGVTDAGADAGAWPLDKVACTWKGKRLYGKVKYVTAFPDVKVKVVTALPDLKVERVGVLASRCGEWEEVTSGSTALEVELVDSFADLEIEYVTAFPGFR